MNSASNRTPRYACRIVKSIIQLSLLCSSPSRMPNKSDAVCCCGKIQQIFLKLDSCVIVDKFSSLSAMYGGSVTALPWPNHVGNGSRPNFLDANEIGS